MRLRARVSPQQSPVMRRRLAAGGLAPRCGALITVGSSHSGLYGSGTGEGVYGGRTVRGVCGRCGGCAQGCKGLHLGSPHGAARVCRVWGECKVVHPSQPAQHRPTHGISRYTYYTLCLLQLVRWCGPANGLSRAAVELRVSRDEEELP